MRFAFPDLIVHHTGMRIATPGTFFVAMLVLWATARIFTLGLFAWRRRRSGQPTPPVARMLAFGLLAPPGLFLAGITVFEYLLPRMVIDLNFPANYVFHWTAWAAAIALGVALYLAGLRWQLTSRCS